MTTEKINDLKIKLEEEKALLEKELSGFGKRQETGKLFQILTQKKLTQSTKQTRMKTSKKGWEKWKYSKEDLWISFQLYKK